MSYLLEIKSILLRAELSTAIGGSRTAIAMSHWTYCFEFIKTKTCKLQKGANWKFELMKSNDSLNYFWQLPTLSCESTYLIVGQFKGLPSKNHKNMFRAYQPHSRFHHGINYKSCTMNGVPSQPSYDLITIGHGHYWNKERPGRWNGLMGGT